MTKLILPPLRPYSGSITGWALAVGLALLGLSGCSWSLELLFDQRAERLSPSAVARLSGFSNSVDIRTEEGTFLVDTKMDGPSGDLVNHLKEEGAWPVKWIVITHAHQDHLGGLATVADASPAPPLVWGAPLLARLSLPKNIHFEPVEGAHQVKRLGNGPGAPTIELWQFSHAHTGGDIAVWIPDIRTLLTGDLFQCGYYPHAERDDGGSYVGLAHAVEELAQLKPLKVIGGHGGICTGKDLDDYVAFLNDTLAGRQVDPGYRKICVPGMGCSATLDRVRACFRSEQRFSEEHSGLFWSVEPALPAGTQFLPSKLTDCQ